MYSPKLMEGTGENADLGRLEDRIGELEALADELGDVPDEELIPALGRAVELLKEVNTGIEGGMKSLGKESREVEGLLDPLDFGEFDSSLENLEKERQDTGEHGP